jgi:hypothetical protein
MVICDADHRCAGSLALIETGLVALGECRDRFSHGSVVGDETFLKEAGTRKRPMLTDWT